MRILLLTPGDPFNHRSWSGTLNSITTTIQKLGHEVLWHGKIPRGSLLLRLKIKKKRNRSLNKENYQLLF